MARKKSKKTLKVILISLAVITVVGFLSNASNFFGNAEEPSDYVDPNENFSGWHLVNNVNQLKDGDDIIFISDLLSEAYMLTPKYYYFTNSIAFRYDINSLNNNGEIYVSEYRNSVFKTKLLDDKFSFKSIYGFMSFDNSIISFKSDNEDSTLFNLSFENDYTLLNYRNSFLDTSGQNFYVSNSTNNIKIFKWYGNKEVVMNVDYSEYDGLYTFDEYELIEAKDYKLENDDIVCPIIKQGESYYAPLNSRNGECGDCNIIFEIKFLGNGFALTEDLLSFYYVTYRGSDFYSLDCVSDYYYDPFHDCSQNSLLIKYYQDDLNTFKDKGYHSNYLTYNQSGVNLGELGFYYCKDANNNGSSHDSHLSPKYCHFGSSSTSIDSKEYDTQNLIGTYGQITHWLVYK